NRDHEMEKERAQSAIKELETDILTLQQKLKRETENMMKESKRRWIQRRKELEDLRLQPENVGE
ncbi:hypothetical protein ACJMK2_012142, partial [Sinanodonta woodiana]